MPCQPMPSQDEAADLAHLHNTSVLTCEEGLGLTPGLMSVFMEAGGGGMAGWPSDSE